MNNERQEQTKAIAKIKERVQLPAAEQKPAKEEQHIVPINVPVRESHECRIEIKHGELSVSFTGEAPPDALRAVVEALRSC